MTSTPCNVPNGTNGPTLALEHQCAFTSTSPPSSHGINANCQEALELASWITNGFLGVVIFLGNAFVCSVFLRSSRLRRIRMNTLLLNLALCDFSMAIIVVPGYGVFCTGCKYTLSKFCWLFEGGKDVCFLASVFSLLAITYDRYLAVFQPLSYRRKMTKKKVHLLLTATWILPIFLASLRNLWQHNRSTQDSASSNVLYSNILLFTCVFCPIVVTAVVNIKIILAIKGQRSALQPHGNFSTCTVTVSAHKVTLSSRKGTMSCVLVVLIFIVCWIPRTCYFLTRLFNRDADGMLLTPLLSKLSVSFLLFQSSVNPGIYSFYRAEFRTAAKQLFWCQQRRR